MKKQLAFVTGIGLASFGTASMAAIDMSAIETEIGTYPAVIASVGTAVITVALAVKGIQWAKAALGR
ncbi:MAG: hypothetical protein CSB44_03695 [Gammaproteobacteria bacterium]|nr:MAG: hypothetical protein CSB44_03695 [Gammaproteobacteria bacterium]